MLLLLATELKLGCGALQELFVVVVVICLILVFLLERGPQSQQPQNVPFDQLSPIKGGMISLYQLAIALTHIKTPAVACD
jgi:hypothetical protein